MSGKRKEPLITREIYHVFNRAIAKQDIFFDENTLKQALNLLRYYRYPQDIRYSQFSGLTPDAKNYYLQRMKTTAPLVDIYSFAFMPNHFHLLLKQLDDNGITTFMSNFQNSFAKYFNLKFDRDGSLFKRPFKAKRVGSESLLLHMSRYIHLNPTTSNLIDIEKLNLDPRTSLLFYTKREEDNFINTEYILGFFGGSVDKYTEFLRDNADYQKELHRIQHLVIY